MTEQNASIEVESVIEVTQAVCECLLVEVAEPRPSTQQPPTDDEVVAWVSISGGWSGDIQVRLSPALAKRLAREVLDVDATSTEDAGVHDVVGEVANMIGGNLKALLPEPCRLSLPKVTHEPSLGYGALTQAFVVGDDPFEVSVKSAA
jgi:chemotaxis protein CheX